MSALGLLQAAEAARPLHPPVVDDWAGLRMEYAVPVPLHLLLTPQVPRVLPCQAEGFPPHHAQHLPHQA